MVARDRGAFWHYILDSAFFGGGGLPLSGADLAGWMIDPSSTGLIGTRTLLRLLIVAGAFMAWWGWRREGDPRRSRSAPRSGC